MENEKRSKGFYWVLPAVYAVCAAIMAVCSIGDFMAGNYAMFVFDAAISALNFNGVLNCINVIHE